MNLAVIFDAFPVLETPRLVLRAIQPTDRQALFAIFSQEAVVRNYDVEQFTSVDEADPLIRFFQQRYAAGQGIRWAITQREEPERLIGTCGFNEIDTRGQRGEIGYELDAAYWRKGIMTEALAAVIRFAFAHVGLHRIEALVAPGNAASGAVLTRLGFTHEGVLRGREYWKERFQDMQLYALLQTDWIDA